MRQGIARFRVEPGDLPALLRALRRLGPRTQARSGGGHRRHGRGDGGHVSPLTIRGATELAVATRGVLDSDFDLIPACMSRVTSRDAGSLVLGTAGKGNAKPGWVSAEPDEARVLPSQPSRAGDGPHPRYTIDDDHGVLATPPSRLSLAAAVRRKQRNVQRPVRAGKNRSGARAHTHGRSEERGFERAGSRQATGSQRQGVLVWGPGQKRCEYAGNHSRHFFAGGGWTCRAAGRSRHTHTHTPGEVGGEGRDLGQAQRTAPERIPQVPRHARHKLAPRARDGGEACKCV